MAIGFGWQVSQLAWTARDSNLAAEQLGRRDWRKATQQKMCMVQQPLDKMTKVAILNTESRLCSKKLVFTYEILSVLQCAKNLIRYYMVTMVYKRRFVND